MDRETRLPPVRRPRRGRLDVGRTFARVLCALLAVVGLLPVGAGLLLRSEPVRAWAVAETSKLLARQGVQARYALEVALWPLSVRLQGLQVDATDGLGPALRASRVAVRPRLFALLSGKLVIDQVEIEEPDVRVVLEGGKLKNLALELPESKPKQGPDHAPFAIVAVSSARLDVTVDGVRLEADHVDADVTVDDDRVLGSSFEIAVSLGQARLHRRREVPGVPGAMAQDDDVVCDVDGRVRVEPHALLVRRFSATGAVDLEDEPGDGPACHLPNDDPRRLELSLAHLRVDFPQKELGDKVPRVSGHVRARGPVALATRFVELPGAGGWVEVDVDGRFGEDTVVPDLAGVLRVRRIKIDKFRFAKEIDAEVVVRKNVVTSPKLTLTIADGLATLTDIRVEPLTKGVPMRAHLEVREADFTALMRDLGVSEHAHVQWALHSVSVPLMAGTLDPLHLDGEMTAATADFAVFDKARDDPEKSRLIGFKEAALAAHVQVRPDALQFKNVHAQLPTSRIDQGFCSIGFHNDLVVEAPQNHVDLVDISPIGDVPMAGEVDADVRVLGKFNDPHLTADLAIDRYVLGDIPFGDVKAGHAAFSGNVVDLSALRVQKGKSTYEVPTARLDFGRDASLYVDATATASSLGLRDFFAIFHMDDDPRFEELDAKIATKSKVHVALGGPEDTCGDGFIDVAAAVHARDVRLYGEIFEDGDANVAYRWGDRRAGVLGADVDVRSFVLHKVLESGSRRPLGSVVGSATLRRGGALAGSFVVESLPLGRMQKLGAFAADVEGAASGFAQVSGTLDAFRLDAELDATPVRLRGMPFGPSHLRASMTQRPSGVKAVGKTTCGGDLFPTFDKEAYLRDTSSQGEYRVSGELLGGQVQVESLTMTRQKDASLSAQVGLQRLDVGALLKAFAPEKKDVAAGEEQTPVPPISGELSGKLSVKELRASDLPHASVRFTPTAFFLERAGDRVSLRPQTGPLIYEGDNVTLPEMQFDLKSASGIAANFRTKGSVTAVTRAGDLNVDMALSPVDLAILEEVVPRVERSAGRLEGAVHVGGHLRDPDVQGNLRVRGGELGFRGSTEALTEMELDIRASESELKVVRGTAKMSGGTLTLTGTMPLRALTPGVAEGRILARDLHVAGIEGVSATVDADLAVTLNPTTASGPVLPRIGGDVLVTSFEYTRPVNLVSDLQAFGARSLGVRSGRTVVESYDPAKDVVTMDLRVRSRVPLRVRNNLVDVQLGVSSQALQVTGTNQRFGLRGELKAQSGGRFHFRANDFEIRQAIIRFDDATRIRPQVDVVGTTEYRRAQATGGAGGAGASGGGVSRAGGSWRISLHAYGDAENLRLDMTSEPALSREDIVLLLTIGMTRAEVDQLQGGSLGAGLALEALANVSGADRAVKAAVPVIDDFRFGSGYSPRVGRTVPQLTVGKRISDDVRASVTTGIAEDRQLRSNIEWRLGQHSSVLGSYDNINDVASSAVGNVGVGFRWRLEFE